MRYREKKFAAHSFKERSWKQTFTHLCINFEAIKQTTNNVRATIFIKILIMDQNGHLVGQNNVALT